MTAIEIQNLLVEYGALIKSLKKDIAKAKSQKEIDAIGNGAIGIIYSLNIIKPLAPLILSERLDYWYKEWYHQIIRAMLNRAIDIGLPVSDINKLYSLGQSDIA